MKKLTICSMFLLMACARLPGSPGGTGAQGPRGVDGSSCTTIPTVEGATIVCTDGTIANIVNGVDGQPGINAMPITVVQFCAGVTPIYPTVFPEVGLCIGNQLYAVYSANNGFLVRTPPGVYNSNAIGSACTFTVLANCMVQ